MADNDTPVPYQIPQTIYIGDAGRLVYPLDAYFFNQTDGVIAAEQIGQSADVVVHRVELNKGRLIVDFQCWRTGVVALPPVNVAGKVVEGMEVRVASLLEGKDAQTVLSPPAPPLAAPGTLWIVSGATTLLITAAALLIFFVLRGGIFFASLGRRRRRWRALRVIRKALKKISLQMEKDTLNLSAAIAGAALELRRFLEVYCGVNCRSLVPAEFLQMEFPAGAMPGEQCSPRYFASFFTRCDTARFSGETISRAAVKALLSEVEAFVNAAALQRS